MVATISNSIYKYIAMDATTLHPCELNNGFSLCSCHSSSPPPCCLLCCHWLLPDHLFPAPLSCKLLRFCVWCVYVMLGRLWKSFLFFFWVMVVEHLQWPGGHCNTPTPVCCRQRNGWPRFDFIVNRLIAYGWFGPSRSCSYEPFSPASVSFLFLFFYLRAHLFVLLCRVCVQRFVCFLWVMILYICCDHLCFVPALLGRRVFVSYQRFRWVETVQSSWVDDKIA